jgi:hypothetical protein
VFFLEDQRRLIQVSDFPLNLFFHLTCL